MHRPTLPVLLVAAVAVFAAPAAWSSAGADDPLASTGSPSATTPDGQTLTPTPNDAELTSFVAAFVRLVGVQHGYMMMMQDERDPARIEQMKRQALTDMTHVVQSQGMTVARYNAIATALESDPNLQTRVEAILRQMAANPDDDGGE